MHMSNVFVAYIAPTLHVIEVVTSDASVLSGYGADHHGVCGVLEQFYDALVLAIPEALRRSGLTRRATRSSTSSWLT